MRILLACDQWYPDFRGGSARVAQASARALVERGHEVAALVPAHAELPADAVDEGVRVVRAIRRGRLPQTLSDPRQTAACARALGGRWDVLLGHQATTSSGLLAAGLGAPLAHVYHASAWREARFLRTRLPWGAARLTTTLLDPLLVRLERRALAGAARILLLSEFSAGLVRADHPGVADRIVRVGAGIDLDAFEPGDGPDAARARLGAPAGPLLLTVRRFEPRMGLEELLRAAAELAPRRSFTLVVIGKGMLDGALRALAAELGLGDRVRFLGGVSDEELRDWYRAADLFVLPTQAYEGFGLATAEALASGTPVVGTPVGATPELLGDLDPRLLAADASPAALVRSIDQALDLVGPALRERCRAYALERYTWEATGASWERALALASNGARPSGGTDSDVPRARDR